MLFIVPKEGTCHATVGEGDTWGRTRVGQEAEGVGGAGERGFSVVSTGRNR